MKRREGGGIRVGGEGGREIGEERKGDVDEVRVGAAHQTRRITNYTNDKRGAFSE